MVVKEIKMSDVPSSSIDLLSPRSFIEQKIDEIKVNNLQFRMRNIDGYVHVGKLCEQNGREFKAFWALGSKKKLLEGIAKELNIPVRTETAAKALQTGGLEILTHPDVVNSPRSKLGAIHCVKHGPTEVRGYWAHPRVALEVIKWISPDYEILVRDLLLKSPVTIISTPITNKIYSKYFSSEERCEDQVLDFSNVAHITNDDGTLVLRIRRSDGYVHLPTLFKNTNKRFDHWYESQNNKLFLKGIADAENIPMRTNSSSFCVKNTHLLFQQDPSGVGEVLSDWSKPGTNSSSICVENTHPLLQEDPSGAGEVASKGPKLGVIHNVDDGPPDQRGNWAHARASLEIVGWINVNFKVWANGVLYRYITGKITTEESQAFARKLFATKGPMKAICDQALTVIYIGIYSVDELKYGITMKSLNERHDAAHTRSYEQIPIMIVLSRADATPVETALERYLNKYNLKSGNEEHFYRDRVQQHFGFPNVEAHHIIVSFLLHADSSPMVVLDPLNRNAVMTAPKDYKEYCDIDENKIIDFKTILEECERSNNKRKQPAKAAIEQESKRFKDEKDHEYRMAKIEEDKHMRELESNRVTRDKELEDKRLARELEDKKHAREVEAEEKRHARELEAQDKRLALEREAEDKKQMIYYELELKRLEIEREKWMAQNNTGNTTAPKPCLPCITDSSPMTSSIQKATPQQTLTTPRRQQPLPSTLEDIKYRNFVRQIHLDIKGHGEWAEKFYTFGEVPKKLIYPGENSSDTVFIAARSLNMCVFCRGQYLGGEKLNAHVRNCDRKPDGMNVQFMKADWMHCPFANDPFE